MSLRWLERGGGLDYISPFFNLVVAFCFSRGLALVLSLLGSVVLLMKLAPRQNAFDYERARIPVEARKAGAARHHNNRHRVQFRVCILHLQARLRDGEGTRGRKLEHK